MVESMAALVLADQLLQHVAQCRTLPFDDNFPASVRGAYMDFEVDPETLTKAEA